MTYCNIKLVSNPKDLQEANFFPKYFLSTNFIKGVQIIQTHRQDKDVVLNKGKGRIIT